jgi:hypothetical protein
MSDTRRLLARGFTGGLVPGHDAAHRHRAHETHGDAVATTSSAIASETGSSFVPVAVSVSREGRRRRRTGNRERTRWESTAREAPLSRFLLLAQGPGSGTVLGSPQRDVESRKSMEESRRRASNRSSGGGPSGIESR